MKTNEEMNVNDVLVLKIKGWRHDGIVVGHDSKTPNEIMSILKVNNGDLIGVLSLKPKEINLTLAEFRDKISSKFTQEWIKEKMTDIEKDLF